METCLQPIYQQISSLHKNMLNGLFATDLVVYTVRLNQTQDNTESNEYIIRSIGTKQQLRIEIVNAYIPLH